MIRAEQIPMEVKLRLRAILQDGETDEARAIAAAFSAWTGALISPDEVIDGELLPPIISLPFNHKGDA